MKKFLLLILIGVLLIAAYVGYANRSLIAAGLSSDTVEEVAVKQEAVDDELISELNELGIQVETIGQAISVPASTAGAPTGTEGVGGTSNNQTTGGGVTVDQSQSGNVGSSSSVDSQQSDAQSTVAKNAGAVKDKKPTGSAVAIPTQSEITLKYYNEFVQFKVAYESELQEMFQNAKVEFTSRTPEEQTVDHLFKFGMECMARADVLEKQADQKCSALMTRFENELKQYDYETAIVTQVRDYYNKYKAVKKEYYMAQLKEHL